MKLYTEYEIYKAFRLLVSKQFLEGTIDGMKSIELPSDEEIREERLLQFPDSEYANRSNDRLAFLCGAKYVINKIQGGNNG